MSERFTTHYRGVLLTLVGTTAVFWLAATNQLTLYIHPRYVIFTVILSALATVAALGSLAVLGARRAGAEHAHEHHHEHPEPPAAETIARRRWDVASSALVVAGTAGALLVLPPATLTSTTATHRDLTQQTAATSDVELTAGAGASYTVREWATLLRQGLDPSELADSDPTLSGFVTADEDDPQNVFYIVRFVVTHCTLDAQPVGVPVYLPGWAESFPVDSWVTASGDFVENPSASSAQEVVLEPADIARIDQPADPYVY